MIMLYHAHISTCSQKVRLCLAEKELEWTSEIIDFSKKEQLQPEYLQLNPNGVVPTLLHNGNPVVDSSVICEYLEETFPDSGSSLMPVDLVQRAKVRTWLRYIEEVPTAAIRYSSFNQLFKPFLQSMSKKDYIAHTESLPLRKNFYRQFAQEGFSDEVIQESV